MQRSRLRSSVRISRLHNHGRNTMPTIEEKIFRDGDFVYLKVSPMRGLRRFKVKGKLALRYVGPFKVLDHRGEVAYQF
jgi:hypothetical protein